MKILNELFLANFPDYDGHKYVIEEQDKKNGLHAFVAIHNNRLGSATGGTRIFPYLSREDAITDVLRLSRAMTYKSAIAGLKHGGGKGVIIADPVKQKTSELLKAYGEFINRINESLCEYTTGEDVGISQSDIEFLSKVSPYIVGTKGKAGNPSPFAALSTYYAMKAAVRFLYNKSDLKGFKISVKGVGKVGSALVDLLVDEGALVFVADLSLEAVGRLKKKHRMLNIIEPTRIHKLDVDIYSPCALGKEFNNENIAQLKCKMVCGAANNQLEDSHIGEILFQKGIYYIPDYLANCGGLINVVDQLEKGGYKKSRGVKMIARVKSKTSKILSKSKEQQKPTNIVADEICELLFK